MYQPYALENKNIFSLDLKILTEEACLIDSLIGKAFQSLGVSIQKVQSHLSMKALKRLVHFQIKITLFTHSHVIQDVYVFLQSKIN